jgi:hypothetical protein
MNTNKKIIQSLEYYSEEQKEFIYELLNVFTSGNIGKGTLIKFAYPDGLNGKVDSALPFQSIELIKDALPSFDCFNYVMDYNDPHNYGQIENLNDKIVTRIIKNLAI